MVVKISLLISKSSELIEAVPPQLIKICINSGIIFKLDEFSPTANIESNCKMILLNLSSNKLR